MKNQSYVHYLHTRRDWMGYVTPLGHFAYHKPCISEVWEVTEIWDCSFLDTSIVYKKLEFTNKTFLYKKIPKRGRVKHCSPYLILCSKFRFQVFKFIFMKVVLDFVIIWRILILAICWILILWKNSCYNCICFLHKSH